MGINAAITIFYCVDKLISSKPIGDLAIVEAKYHRENKMNLVVHLKKQMVKKHGYEWATRQAWKCGIKANLIKRVIGVFKGQIVCIVEGCRAELSTSLNNPLHDDEKQGRYVFVGGVQWEPNNIIAPGFPDFMFMHLRNLSCRHKYMTDDELFLNLA